MIALNKVYASYYGSDDHLLQKYKPIGGYLGCIGQCIREIGLLQKYSTVKDWMDAGRVIKELQDQHGTIWLIKKW